MYGVDKNTNWIDYDFTTGMADLALPDYYIVKFIDVKELDNWTADDFLKGYLIVNAYF